MADEINFGGNKCSASIEGGILTEPSQLDRAAARKAAEKRLIEKMPLMKCGNRTEFKQRLQWLSEGMLRNHLEHIIHYKPDPAEIEAYRKYKEELK